MVSRNLPDTTLKNTPKPVTFHVQRDRKQVEVTYQQLFALGHKLWLDRKYGAASKVFEHLTTVTDRGPRAHILLAHCRVMLGDYAGCSTILSEALPGEQFGNVAADLHNTFVMWRCTMFVDVRAGLEKIIKEYPELPTPCLIFADFLTQAGNQQKPPAFLRLAITRDRPDGAISRIARHELPVALRKAAKLAALQSSASRPVKTKTQSKSP